MKTEPIRTGVIALVSPIPLFIFTAIWCLIWSMGIGVGIFHYETIPTWILAISLAPLLISPILGISGIIQGIMRINEHSSCLGIILSVISLAENFVLLYVIYYLGSRF